MLPLCLDVPDPKASETKRKRIIVAEDDAAIAGLIVRVLSQHYDVVHAANGSAALRLATELPTPNLLMLDVMMPDMDGFGVANRVRAIPQLKQVPIIFLTARTAAPDIIRGIQMGARHYIQKPFKIEEVLSKVKKALGD